MTIYTQEVKLEWLKGKLHADNPSAGELVDIKPPTSREDWLHLTAKYHNFPPVYSSIIWIVMQTADDRKVQHPLMMIDVFPPDEFTDEFTLLDYTLANWIGCYRTDETGKPIQPTDEQWTMRMRMYEYVKGRI